MRSMVVNVLKLLFRGLGVGRRQKLLSTRSLDLNDVKASAENRNGTAAPTNHNRDRTCCVASCSCDHPDYAVSVATRGVMGDCAEAS